MMENNPSDIVNFWLPGCRKPEKVEGGRHATIYGKMPTNLWVMINALAGAGGLAAIVVG